MIITMWYVYPDMVHEFFKLFACITLKDGSVRSFRDHEIQCWEGDHLIMVTVIGIPLLIIYVVGIPALLFYALHKSSNEIKLLVSDTD